MKRLVKQFVGNERGSAMIIALTAVALLGLMASATMTISGIMATDLQRKAQTKVVNSFVQTLEAIATNPTSCMGTTTGNGSSPNELKGLRFNPTGSTNGNLDSKCNSSCLQKGLATTPDGKLFVSLDTNFGEEARNGRAFTSLGLQINQLYLEKIAPVAGSTTTYTGNLVVSVSTTTQPIMSFAPREIGKMNLTFAGDQLTACNSAPSAKSLCESMDCAFNDNAPAGVQKCSCGFPEMACGPGEYISGVKADGTPNCTFVELQCDPGFFFAGVDPQGKPVCLAVEGSFGVTTPPPPAGGCWIMYDSYTDLSDINTAGWPSAYNSCGAGIRQLGSGAACSPIGADCEFQFKYGARYYRCDPCPGVLPTPPPCTGGADTTLTASPATPAGCYCPDTLTWDGSNCVTPTAPSGCGGLLADGEPLGTLGVCNPGDAGMQVIPSSQCCSGEARWMCRMGTGEPAEITCGGALGGGSGTWVQLTNNLGPSLQHAAIKADSDCDAMFGGAGTPCTSQGMTCTHGKWAGHGKPYGGFTNTAFYRNFKCQ